MPDLGRGSGSRLPPGVLLAASLSAGFATVLSIWCIIRQLKNYRKPLLQRFVVRILIMVPIYSISSLVSLFSLDAAFFIDAIRDVYEAFVIYCFFALLVEYLGGERSLIILLHGRKATPHPWPVSHFLSPMDISDPYTFLALKRGILQYVQVKPVLAVLTMIFKATGTYKDGSLSGDNGYTYVSIAYNLSVSISLYSLAMFWVCTNSDLKPFRPMPKFLCVKGIIFFSFWQGFAISILVAAGVLKSSRYDSETLSLAVQDTLICFEMPLFAILHLYAFSHKDYEDPKLQYSGRMPLWYALRDSVFGFKDVLEDSLTTLKGTGFSYRTFEPAEGALHQGEGRERRVRAGLRYAAGGKAKYWLPMPGASEQEAYGRKDVDPAWKRPFAHVGRIAGEHEAHKQGYAPITPQQAETVIHRDPREDGRFESPANPLYSGGEAGRWDVLDRLGPRAELEGVAAREYDSADSDDSDVDFADPRADEERLYKDARQLEFGDYNNPVVDASKEQARRLMREQEDGILYGRPSRKGKERRSPQRPKRSLLHSTTPPSTSPERPSRPPLPARNPEGSVLPDDCVDLLVKEPAAEVDLEAHERLKGEANLRGDEKRKVFRRLRPELAPKEPEADRRRPRVLSETSSGRLEESAVDVRPGASTSPQERAAIVTRVPSYAQQPQLVHPSDGDNPWA